MTFREINTYDVVMSLFFFIYLHYTYDIYHDLYLTFRFSTKVYSWISTEMQGSNVLLLWMFLLQLIQILSAINYGKMHSALYLGAKLARKIPKKIDVVYGVLFDL